MSKFVIGDEQAVKEFEEICEFWETESKATDGAIINAIKRGRITFDNATGEITYKLRFPVKLHDGSELNEVKLNQVSAEKFRTSKGDDEQKGMNIVAACCGLPLGVFDRILAKDLTVIAQVAGFFS